MSQCVGLVANDRAFRELESFVEIAIDEFSKECLVKQADISRISAQRLAEIFGGGGGITRGIRDDAGEEQARSAVAAGGARRNRRGCRRAQAKQQVGRKDRRPERGAPRSAAEAAKKRGSKRTGAMIHAGKPIPRGDSSPEIRRLFRLASKQGCRKAQRSRCPGRGHPVCGKTGGNTRRPTKM